MAQEIKATGHEVSDVGHIIHYEQTIQRIEKAAGIDILRQRKADAIASLEARISERVGKKVEVIGFEGTKVIYDDKSSQNTIQPASTKAKRSRRKA